MPIPALLAAAPLIAKGVTGAVSAIRGLFQKGRARKLAEQNVRPIEEIQPEFIANQQLAQKKANEGMGGAQYEQAKQDISRQAAEAVNRTQSRRGALGAISAVQSAAGKQQLGLDVQSEALRTANQRQLMNVNLQTAQEKKRLWDWNFRQKYIENAQAIRALAGAGEANVQGGLNTFLSAGAQYGAGLGKTGEGTLGGQVPNTFAQSNPVNSNNPYMWGNPQLPQ